MKKLVLIALIGLSGTAQAESCPNSSPWGEIIGAFAGAYVGNRVSGDGLGTILGAVAGGYAGGKVEENLYCEKPVQVKSLNAYCVDVRNNDPLCRSQLN